MSKNKKEDNTLKAKKAEKVTSKEQGCDLKPAKEKDKKSKTKKRPDSTDAGEGAYTAK
jgi:hypothetical protein